jgi:hypothetical protein
MALFARYERTGDAGAAEFCYIQAQHFWSMLQGEVLVYAAAKDEEVKLLEVFCGWQLIRMKFVPQDVPFSVHYDGRVFDGFVDFCKYLAETGRYTF